MSISVQSITKLKNHFVKESKTYKDLISKRKYYENEIINILKDYYNKQIDPEDIDILKKEEYFTDVYIDTGIRFREKYNTGKIFEADVEYEMRRNNIFRDISITLPYLAISGGSYYRELKIIEDKKLLDKLLKINNKILEVDKDLCMIGKTFDRLITKDTKLTWLKKNLPEIYKYLKNNN